MHRLLPCLALLLLVLCASAKAADETWMTVLADGRKVGSAHNQRTVTGDTVISRQSLTLVFERSGTHLRVSSVETDTETLSGEPLAFESRTDSAGSRSEVRGTRQPDGRFALTRRVGSSTQESLLDWPANALLAEGQRLASLHALKQAGDTLALVAYDPQSGAALHLTATAIGPEKVDLPGGEETLLRVEETTALPVGETRSTVWLDSTGNARKIRLQAAGITLDMLACSKACAEAPTQAADVFAHSMTQLPRRLTPRDLAGTLRYHLRSRDGRPLHFATTNEQRVESDGKNGWLVRVGPADGNREAAPTADDTHANAWLQADNAEIRTAARKAVGTLVDSDARMRRLTAFVRQHIRDKDLSVGYATALDTLHSRQGDCTEHAVLLAALARALDIPARVVTGLAYAPNYAGQTNVLVPHAWVQAWVNGRWHSFDAALGQFDAGHIALDVGNGDPWRFFAGLDTLGRIRVDGVRKIRP
ncbi:MAG TPA: transglutaminase-like domain-containing protein [Rhodanobacteraceae bacterium]|nr:transglutaminase-like domain-containing protein [Rhodanobacteraceae bacterium]